MSPTDIRPAQRQAWWAALAAPLSASMVAPLVALSAALLLASLARHRLVEPAALTALCDAMPWDSPRCILRSLTVQAFAGGPGVDDTTVRTLQSAVQAVTRGEASRCRPLPAGAWACSRWRLRCWRC